MDLDEFAKLLVGRQRFLAAPLSILRRDFGEFFVQAAGRILPLIAGLAARMGLSVETALERYTDLVIGQLAEMKRFRERRSYRFSTVAEVEAALDPARRSDIFLSLAFSYLLAPHRYRLLRLVEMFTETEVQRRHTCLQLGVGVGLEAFFIDNRGARLEAYDPNPYSGISLESLGLSQRVRLHESLYDFGDSSRFDVCYLVELLEHVEDPLEYLKNTVKVLKPGGICLATFAIRMPQADHIYLFDSVSSAREVVGKTQFSIISEEFLIATFLKYDESARESLAENSRYGANYVCVLRKP